MEVVQVNTNTEIVRDVDTSENVMILQMTLDPEKGGDGEEHVESPNQTAPLVNWSRQAILELIALHGDHNEYFQNTEYKKKSVWEMLARRLKERGYAYSWIQLENKWKSLTKNYRDAVNHNLKNGHIMTRTCAFFKEMSEVYDYNPTVTESATPVSSTAPSSIIHMRGTKRSSDTTTDEVLPRKKKFMNSNVQPKPDIQDLNSVLKSFNEERKRQDKIKLDRLEKMHREKMEMFSSFLKVFKDSLNK